MAIRTLRESRQGASRRGVEAAVRLILSTLLVWLALASTVAAQGDVGVAAQGDAQVTAARRTLTATSASGWRVTASIDGASGTFSIEVARGRDVLTFGWEWSIDFGDGTVGPPPDERIGTDMEGWLRDELAGYVASPASFRRQALARMGALKRHVHRVVDQLSVCPDPRAPTRYQHRPGPPGSGAVGMFDMCARRLLTATERGALLARLDAQTARQSVLVRRHAADWNRTLRALLSLPPAR